jgi:hypothetical protein
VLSYLLRAQDEASNHARYACTAVGSYLSFGSATFYARTLRRYRLLVEDASEKLENVGEGASFVSEYTPTKQVRTGEL